MFGLDFMVLLPLAVLVFALGALFSTEYAFERLSVMYAYIKESAKNFARPGAAVEIAKLSTELEYCQRNASAFKQNADQLMAKLKNSEFQVEVHSREVSRLKREIEESRIELAAQYKDWVNLREDKDGITKKLRHAEETLHMYSKLLTEERMEGFQQAQQIGNLKNENVRLVDAITKLEQTKKKSARRYPELHKR